ncbi:MAG: MoaD/ThiS family protein [Bacteroidota bacterium]|nr:MoaD/ThiS family protein [Bacteroidota bacterium]MDP4274384.1 MoaD/ThiS family protein [Bacteroidota bacterium]
MKIKIICFGEVADIIGKKQFELKDIIDSASLKGYLAGKYPALSKIHYQVALNKILNKADNFKNNDEIALLPPFYGG